MRSSNELAADAAAAVANDAEVVNALGGPVRCSAPSAASSSTQIINGVRSTLASLSFVAEGSSGRRARVDVTERNGDTNIQVTLGTGAVIRVGRVGAKGSSGGVIDLDDGDYRVQ